jgi:predicted membrane chloride channel (bestrophin family)
VSYTSINNTIRDMGRQIMMWMEDEDQRNRMLKLCQAFPMTHMWHVHVKGCHHNIRRNAGPGKAPFKDRIHAEFMAELRDIYNDGTFEADFARLSRVKHGGGNTPLEVLTMMGETVAGCKGSVDPIYAREIDEQMQRLCAAYGASERVLRTPLPTGYARHSSRLLFLWSHCLPFALYSVTGPLGTLPAALLTGWTILGIEDLGVQLEEPFDILPMRQYSDGMYDAMNQIKNGYKVYRIGSDDRVSS